MKFFKFLILSLLFVSLCFSLPKDNFIKTKRDFKIEKGFKEIGLKEKTVLSGKEKIMNTAVYFGMKENPQKLSSEDKINAKDKDFQLKLAETKNYDGKKIIKSCDLKNSIGSISGYVYDLKEAPLKGIQLYLLPISFSNGEIGSFPLFNYYAETDENGFFLLYFDLEGSYILLASDPNSIYLPQYYDHKDSYEEADVLILKNGDVLTNLNFNLKKSASISGRIIDAKTGEGVWGIYVYTVNPNQDWEYGLPYFIDDITDDEGNYHISGLSLGTYEIHTIDFGNFYGEYTYPEKITITAYEDITGIDFSLNPTSTGIKGKISLPNGEPASNGWVYATSNTLQDPWDNYWTYTNSKGEYRIGTKVNKYVISASTFDDTTLTTYYPGVRNFKDAKPVKVDENTIVENIDFQLLPAGFIEGKVLSDSLEPLQSIYVEVFDKQGFFVNHYVTNENGEFKIGGLDEGIYYLFAWDSEGNYSPQWYNNKKTFEDADPVNVKMGEITSGILFKLKKAGKIVGYVLDSQTLNPVKDIFLFAYDENFYYESYGFSQEDGYFEIKGLQTGSYIVFSYDLNGEYIPTYYDSVTDVSLATEVQVIEGADTNITFKILKGGKIKGKVFSNTNLPLNYAYITALDLNGNWCGFGYTSDDGSYYIGGLMGGTYILYAQDGTGQYAPKWYENADSPDEAKPINLNLGQTIENINFYLPPAGSISGKVTDMEGNPLSYMILFAEKITQSNFNSYEVQWASTDENGNYKIIGLGTGDYRVGVFLPNGLIYYYDGTFDPDKAKPVPVLQGEETKNIDFKIDLNGGRIKGKVSDSSNSEPIAYAAITVFDEFGIPVSFGMTDEEGNFFIYFLAPGKYKVSAWAYCYKEEWYKEKDSYSSANTINIRENGFVSGIDFTLEPDECIY